MYDKLPLLLRPGMYTDLTTYAAKDQYVSGDKVRFYEGFPESVGGAEKYDANITFDGVPRSTRQWAQLDGTFTIAVGTHKKVELEIGGTKSDITPFDFVVDGTLGSNPFTTNGTTTVSVAHTSHGRAVGDVVMFANAPTLDAIDLGKYAWEVAAITDANNYTFVADTTASGSTAGGGGTGVTYHYNSEVMGTDPFTTTSGSATVTVADTAHGLSTGATVVFSGASSFNNIDPNGTWQITKINDNSFSFEAGTSATSSGSGGGSTVRKFYCVDVGASTGTSMRIPCLQTWGEDLLFTLGNDSRIYLWDATLGVAERARAIPRAPTSDFILVSSDDQSLVAFGTDSDDMNINWSTQGDYTIWTAAATNTSGDKRLLRGSELVGASPVTGGSLVFTDTAAHFMTFTGGQFVFSITFIAATKLVGPEAVCEHNGVAYWQSKDNFWIYDGRARALRCTVRKHIFEDINTTEARGSFAVNMAAFNEVWFFSPSASATYPDRYAIFAEEEAEMPWAVGTWSRTAGMDKDIYDYPLWLDSDGNMFKHEFGTEDDGAILNASIRTGDIQPDASGNYFFIGKRLILDMILTGNVYVTGLARSNQQDSYYSAGPELIEVGDTDAWLRWRSRRIAIEVATPTETLEPLATESGELLLTEDGEVLLADGVLLDTTTSLATTWRLGVPIAEVRRAGRR